jgi:hypothetical protein
MQRRSINEVRQDLILTPQKVIDVVKRFVADHNWHTVNSVAELL